MSHQENWQEYGLPISKEGGKTSSEVHDAFYGKYKERAAPAPAAGMPTHLDPKPFTLK